MGSMAEFQGSLPPHAIEAEASLLGGLLLDNRVWEHVSDVVVDSDFYRYEHRLIYAAVAKLITASRPADVITVYEELQRQGKAEETRGLTYLNSLAEYRQPPGLRRVGSPEGAASPDRCSGGAGAWHCNVGCGRAAHRYRASPGIAVRHRRAPRRP